MQKPTGLLFPRGEGGPSAAPIGRVIAGFAGPVSSIGLSSKRAPRARGLAGAPTSKRRRAVLPLPEGLSLPTSSVELFPRIPKGFRNKAQGCEERATLGKRDENGFQPQRGVATDGSSVAPQPRCGFERCGQHSQGRRGAPTLGFAPKSLWDLRISDLDLWVMTSPEGEGRGEAVHPEVVGEDRRFFIRRGPEGRGTWRVFRGAGPGRFHL